MDNAERFQQHLKYIQNQRQQIEKLRGQVERLEKLWFLTCPDPQLRWLYENRSERMDPNIPLFDEGRAAFHLDRYRFAADYVAGKRVADIACGTGYGTQILKENGGADTVVGVDIDADAIAYANGRYASQGVRFLQVDGAQTCFEHQNFDVVVSFETIEHVPDDETLLNEFHRILKPGGVLICSTPNMWPLEMAPHHVRVYDRAGFEDRLKSRFDSVELFNQNSGTSFEFNRGQPRAIVPTTDQNETLAECFLAVARRS